MPTVSDFLIEKMDQYQEQQAMKLLAEAQQNIFFRVPDSCRQVQYDPPPTKKQRRDITDAWEPAW